MGNNMGGGTSKTSKIMKINGENFKLKIPAKVFDVIKDYPDHILLDSEEFLRFNLRAKPLNPDFELKPRKIYLLVELPKFPLNNTCNNNTQTPLRKVRSGVLAPTTTTKDLMSRRSASDDLTLITRSMADNGSSVGPTRVKIKLPKAQVQRIMEENGDDVEAAKKIIQLCLEDNPAVCGGVAAVEVEERENGGEVNVESRRRCSSVYDRCSPCSSYRRKYKKLTS
ncbi:uncharacterized protein At1g66480-like [Chenopodium quinoa]|uniref:uncharacterized protein At1g66480-like n=1 Tax=Chenopodium quinoa TaxID=63459 RepID=UPI000B7705FB|nr:uncharacterized protein At1g66480-like [Chenopodium quinoa]